MKKVYCFNCQKDVTSVNFGKWRFCPHCFHKLDDNGEGLYLVCDKCGANLPVNATHCLKCGHGVNGHDDFEKPLSLPSAQTSLNWLMQIGLFILSLLVAVGIIYLSFYVLLFCLIFGLGYYLYSSFKGY